MNEHPNARLVRHAYEAFAAGDIDLVRAALARDVVWHQPGRSMLAGDHKGPDEVLALLRQFKELSDGTFVVDVVTMLADSERVVVLQEETARRGDRMLDAIAAVDYEVHAGKVTEVTVYHGDMYGFDEFWG